MEAQAGELLGCAWLACAPTASRGGCSIAGSVNGGITLRSGTDGPVGLNDDDLARFAGVLVMFEFVLVFVLVRPGGLVRFV